MIQLSERYRINTDLSKVILEKLTAIGAPKDRKRANPMRNGKKTLISQPAKTLLWDM